MTILLRVVLLAVSFITLWYVMRKIRNSQFQIGDSVYWIIFFLLLFVLGAVPTIGMAISNVLGFASPVNFVFVAVIFMLLVKLFFQSIQMSQMDNKIRLLAQKIAIDNHKPPEVCKDRGKVQQTNE